MALSGLQLKWSQHALPAMAASCTATPDAGAIKEILARAEHAPIIGAAAPVAAACTELRGPAMAQGHTVCLVSRLVCILLTASIPQLAMQAELQTCCARLTIA